MSIIKHSDLILSEREKVIKILRDEVCFLKRFNLDDGFLKITLERMENFLNIVKMNDHKLSESDFDEILMNLYHLIKNINDYLE